MERLNRVRAANDIYDKRSLRLQTIESVCSKFVHLHGTRYPVDEHQCALFLWISNEARAARMALQELRNLVHEATEKTTTDIQDTERQ
jgi:hypothetical protein